MTTKLYIVGNGFDIHHGIPSSYSEFGKFLLARDRETAQLFEEYFSVDELFWSEFESRLASFDAYGLLERAVDFLVPYCAED